MSGSDSSPVVTTLFSSNSGSVQWRRLGDRSKIQHSALRQSTS